MCKKINKIAAFVACIVFSSSLFAMNPCEPIAAACKKANYYQGGHKAGKGLFIDCVLPVTEKKMTLDGVKFSNSDLNACNKIVRAELKSRGMM